MTTSTTIPSAVSGRSALEVARASARAAGAIALENFRRPQDITVKGRGNLMTETDLAMEREIKTTLAREFPAHRILAEETSSDTDTAGWVWVVDPLDGTRNFVSGIPYFSVNIALCLGGDPVVAVTYDPNQDEIFSAEQGAGAWVNDVPAGASGQPSLATSVVSVDVGYDEQRGRSLLRLARELLPDIQTIRISGSAALGLAYAACGRYDLFIHRYLYPWDVAAGILLVQEAGGTITNDRGEPITLDSRSAIAGGPKVHADLFRWREAHHFSFDEGD